MLLKKILNRGMCYHVFQGKCSIFTKTNILPNEKENITTQHTVPKGPANNIQASLFHRTDTNLPTCYKFEVIDFIPIVIQM